MKSTFNRPGSLYRTQLLSLNSRFSPEIPRRLTNVTERLRGLPPTPKLQIRRYSISTQLNQPLAALATAQSSPTKAQTWHSKSGVVTHASDELLAPLRTTARPRIPNALAPLHSGLNAAATCNRLALSAGNAPPTIASAAVHPSADTIIRGVTAR